MSAELNLLIEELCAFPLDYRRYFADTIAKSLAAELPGCSIEEVVQQRANQPVESQSDPAALMRLCEDLRRCRESLPGA